MPGSTTIPLESESLSGRPSDEDVFALVIAWCADEPGRAGELAVVLADRKPAVLGRGDEGETERVRFFRQRPGTVTPTAPLASAALSRKQLVLTACDGALVVENAGRCEMRVNGETCARADVGPGDVIHVRKQLVLLCVRRPPRLPALRHFPREAMRDFGQPDAVGVLGESPASWRLREAVAFAAKTGTHALVVGESGTGKELAAHAIHALSRWAKGPFVARNAATLPAGLIDAELFGNVKNYPNVGMPERPGLVGQANGGTLFLDEIGELPTDLQAHLLRVLDAHGEYQRLGEAAVRRSDFRLVAATNRDSSTLKHDVLARFASRVELTALRERPEDIPLLVAHLLVRAAEKSPEAAARFLSKTAEGSPCARVDAGLIEHVLRRSFPANTRELDALLWRAMSESPGDVVVLPAREVGDGPAASAGAVDAKSEEDPTLDAIRAALAEAKGSVARAASRLGLSSRYALYRLMKKHGIDGDAER